MGKNWLVYSREHNAFWRPNACGYTYDITQAGRYTKNEAERHCDTRDQQRDGGSSEVMVVAPEIGDFCAGYTLPGDTTLGDVLGALGDIMERALDIRDAWDQEDAYRNFDNAISRTRDLLAKFKED